MKRTTERPLGGNLHLVSDPNGVRYELSTVEPRAQNGETTLVKVSGVRAKNLSKSGRIVVGVDGSEASLVALKRGVRIARALGASVEAVTSWRSGGDTIDGDELIDWAEQDARNTLDDASLSVFGAEPPAWFTTVAIEGSAEQVLLNTSKGAEMLIVGSRGHGGLAGVLLGSVSAICAERAFCPVLIVH